MPRRLVTAALCAAVVATAPVLASAAPAPLPQIVDARGDAAAGQQPLDIVSVLFKTTGVTKVTRVGKRRKVTYTPTRLLIVQTLAAPPSSTTGVRYRVEAVIAGCGNLDVYYANGAGGPVGYVALECPRRDDPTKTGTVTELLPKVAGSTLTWELEIARLPKEVKVGAKVSGFRAFSDVGDPVFGLLGTGDGAENAGPASSAGSGVAVADVAVGDGEWRLG
ncbi:MAG TPA: hypothetical protein VNA20_11585 [Frankiaceae bacterium]|nr:hypothetical protein [Frankiaceae bacterium]